MKKEVLEHYWDEDGYEFEKPPTDFDNKPVIGLRSDLEFVIK